MIKTELVTIDSIAAACVIACDVRPSDGSVRGSYPSSSFMVTVNCLRYCKALAFDNSGSSIGCAALRTFLSSN